MNPFLSEIRLMSFDFAPKGWAKANGQLLPINQNQALFSLLGTTYGGDGRVNFALPDLRGRVAMSQFGGHTMGERGGEESHTLIQSEMPAHVHILTTDVNTQPANASGTPVANDALGISGAKLNPGGQTTIEIYSSGSGNMVAMAPQMVASRGGSQPHENRQPFLALNYCIALQGIFPSQN